MITSPTKPQFSSALLIASAMFSMAHGGMLQADEDLAEKAIGILQSRCSRCHGSAAKQAGLDVLSRESLLEKRGAVGSEFSFLVPGNNEKSQLLDALTGDDSYMPQEGSPEAKAMTAAEKQVLREWVAAGAVFPKRRTAKFVSEKQILTSISTFLLKSKADDRQYLRFFTFAHLNNNDSISELELRYYKAALSKVVNSLSNMRDACLPRAIDGSDDTVFVVDLRRVGWEQRGLWDTILKEYPYGLKYDFVKDEELQQLGKDVALFAGGELPYVRGDWFTVTASRPPLYHTILDIPMQVSVLEKRLGLNIESNFKSGQMQRAGYAKSGVSQQNRMIERHTPPSTPYFWISYDFLPRRAKGDLVRFPLGPVFKGNAYPKQAFEHDGGEVIWSLPNGMQAFMLADGKGGRIDSGPIDVVFDRAGILGGPQIVNGISCMYCHREGMISNFRDEIRGADAVAGDARKKVLEIYPTHEEMQKLVRSDSEVFLRASEKIFGPFLKIGNDSGKAIGDFPEPVGKVAEMYSRDLTPNEIAFELGIEKSELLQAKIEANRELLRFGLGTIVQQPPGTIKREKWESKEGTSLMQDVASELRLGLPIVR